MPRSPVAVRPATLADLPELMDLWAELHRTRGRAASRGASRELPVNVEERLRTILTTGTARVLVGCLDGAAAGMAVVQPVSVGPLTDAAALHVSHVVVRRGQRHRGVGRALLAAAAGHAEELGLDDVMVSVYPTMREANRFYARLGFAPLAVRRAAPVPVLRRRLGGSERPATGPDRLASVRQLAARRSRRDGRRPAAQAVPPR